jgi:hypothetical protein
VIRTYDSTLMRVPTDRGYLGGGGPVMRAARHAVRQGAFKLEYWANRGLSYRTSAGSRTMSPLDRVRLGWHKFDHFGYWVHTELQDYVRASLLDDPSAAVGDEFAPAHVAQVVGDHFAGRANHTSVIDQLLTLAMVRKTLLRPVSSVAMSDPAIAVARG